MSSACDGEIGNDALKQECLHDIQTEMERLGSLSEMKASISHVKWYVVATEYQNDAVINQLSSLKNTLRSQCVQGMV